MAEEFDWSFGKRYEQWVAARKKYGTLTEENWPPLATGKHPDWPWDEHHIYQLCPHGKRYCDPCGTTMKNPRYTAEQWSEANKRIEQGKASAKERERGMR